MALGETNDHGLEADKNAAEIGSFPSDPLRTQRLRDHPRKSGHRYYGPRGVGPPPFLVSALHESDSIVDLHTGMHRPVHSVFRPFRAAYDQGFGVSGFDGSLAQETGEHIPGREIF